MPDLSTMSFADLATHHGAKHPLVEEPSPFGGNYREALEKRENSTRGVTPCDTNTCILCGRFVNPTTRPWYVYVVAGAAALCHIEDIPALEDADHMGSMGIFPIGPACKRKLPKGYASKDI